MRKLFLTVFVAIGLSLSAASCDSKKNADSVDAASDINDARGEEFEKDADFAVDAADDGIFEVEIGKLAAQRATSPRVQEFARMMVVDHTKASEELRALAAARGMALPDVMSEERREQYYDLDRKRGAEFDREYMDLMVSAHKDAVDLFERIAESGESLEIRDWAASKVPVLQHHLEEAERIRDSLRENAQQT